MACISRVHVAFVFKFDVRHHLPFFEGRRNLGNRHSGSLGLRDREFRVVDRDRPCGHFHLGDSLSRSSGMAHVDQPLRGSDDVIRGFVRGLYPLLHLGRPWFAYWIFPYPNTMDLWPQFRSPLIWDAFAVLTYATVSLIFWYIGLVPDLASIRDNADKLWQKRLYAVLSLGWRGQGRHWVRYQTIYVILAALATPLVLSVHSLVSMDFTASLLPGWHSTIFPPFFRGRRHFLGIRDGLDLGNSDAFVLWA